MCVISTLDNTCVCAVSLLALMQLAIHHYKMCVCTLTRLSHSHFTQRVEHNTHPSQRDKSNTGQ